MYDILLYIRQPFFIDHASRSTTFIDPRLPLDVVFQSGVLSEGYALRGGGGGGGGSSGGGGEDDTDRVNTYH